MTHKSIPLLAFLICILLLKIFPVSVFGQVNSPIYQCAPCGCSHDGRHFQEPGNCPSCGMKLEEVKIPHSTLKTLDKPLNVAILIYPHAQVLDFAGPYDIFVAGGENFNVYMVAENIEAVTTMPNFSVNPKYNFSNAPRSDILIIPGGMWNTISEGTKAWVSEGSKQTDHVLSVCTGAFILADLGLLDSLDATTHSAGIDLLEENYPSIKEVQSDVRFVDNGKIITSGGVTAGMDASLHLISKILGDAWVEAIKRNLEYQY